MKKFLTIMLVMLLAVSFTVPAFATEVIDNGDLETGDSSNVVNPVDDLDNPQVGADNGGESSETPGGGSDGGSAEQPMSYSEDGSEPSEAPESSTEATNPVVDISQGSIDAIVNGINGVSDYSYTYMYQYSIVGSNGVTYLLDTNEPNLFTEHNVLISHQDGSYPILYIDCNQYLSSTGANLVFDDNLGFWTNGLQKKDYGYYRAFETVSSLVSATAGGGNPFSPVWSNYHVYDCRTGDLIFESTYAAPIEYTVSFVTGFDDLQIESMSHVDFVAPTPKYAGYTFAGWYLDADLTQEYTGGEISQDITLYARWLENPKMAMFHETIFEAFVKFFTYEPMVYIFSLVGLICVFAVGRRLIASRY